MKLGAIDDLFIQEGIRSDLRGREAVRRQLKASQRRLRRLTQSQKRFFDKNSFLNPYPDSRILYGDRKKDIRHILVGIDIGVSELLLADQFRRQSRKIDLVLSHHPQGTALSGLLQAMTVQTDLLEHLGIAKTVAEDLMNQRIEEVSRRVHGTNYARVVDAARMLELPLMCCHTVADNHVASFLQRLMDSQKPKTLESIVRLLLRQKEFRESAFHHFGPAILAGKPQDKAGKVFIDMTGGTEGSKEVFARLSQAGISTIVGMHFSEGYFERIKKEHINVINAGHMASDSLGMNLVLDKLLKADDFVITECSGFRRVER